MTMLGINESAPGLPVRSSAAAFAPMPSDSGHPHIFFHGIDGSPSLPAKPVRKAGVYPPTRPLIRRATRESRDEPPHPLAARILAYFDVQCAMYRGEPLNRRIPAVLRSIRARSAGEAAWLLRNRPELRQKALNAMLIGVTEFFRDPDVFQYLYRHVLPSLLRMRRGLRIASFGCSTGEELYSVALMLDRVGSLGESCLEGADCRESAISVAKTAVYPASAANSAQDEWLARYRTAAGFIRMPEHVRRAVAWLTMDLRRYCPEGPLDLVLFRNVSIYLDPVCCATIWRRIAALLRPGGVVVAGKAEVPGPETGLVRLHPCVYAKSQS